MRRHFIGTDLGETIRATGLIRETYWGKGGNDSFIFFNGDATNPDPDFSDRFIGGAGNDIIQGLFVGLNDYHKYRLLSFDGGAGYDSIRYDVTDAFQTSGTSVMELDRFDTVSRSVERNIFDITMHAATETLGHLTVHGSTMDETVRLDIVRTLPPTTSVVRITLDLKGGDDTFQYVGTWRVNTKLNIQTGFGHDTVIINDTNSVNSNTKGSIISTGAGNDLVVLEGMHRETVHLGGGDDTIYLLTGGFAEVPDTITTGKGNDRIFMELDEYSKVGRIKDFDPANDMIVFDRSEFRNTDVTFDRTVWETSAQPRLYMENATGKLWFGDNVMVRFINGAQLTAANFETDDFLF